MLRSRICPETTDDSSLAVDDSTTSPTSRLSSKRKSRCSYRILVLFAVNVVLFVSFFIAELGFLGYKVITKEQYENLQDSMKSTKHNLQHTEIHRNELERTNRDMSHELDALKRELESFKQKSSSYKKQLEQAKQNATHLVGKVGGLEKQLKENTHVTTEWETCMASSGVSAKGLHEKGFLSLPSRRNISLEEAFRSDSNTTVYFLHQRKNGGTSLSKILFDKYAEVIANEAVGKYNKEKKNVTIDKKTKKASIERAKSTSWIPCLHADDCNHSEMKVQKMFRLDNRLVVGRHQTYHIPFARSMWENQVLITNFRSPLKRIESCIKYRFPDLSTKLLDRDDVVISAAVERIFAEHDHAGASCLGEAFRILSPFNPDFAVEPIEVQKMCCYIKTAFHIIDWSQKRANMTLVESELTEKLHDLKWNRNERHFSDRYQENMDRFIAHAASHHPVVQSEMQLYDCIREAY